MLDAANSQSELPNQTIKIERNIMTNETNNTATYNDAFTWVKSARAFNDQFDGVDFDCSPEEIADVFEANAFNSKESYLAWRESFRFEIAAAEKMRKAIKQGLPDVRHLGKDTITRMIEIRRASKIAAGVQRKKSLTEAA